MTGIDSMCLKIQHSLFIWSVVFVCFRFICTTDRTSLKPTSNLLCWKVKRNQMDPVVILLYRPEKGTEVGKRKILLASSLFMMYHVFLCQLSVLRLLSWRLKQQHSRGTGPDWPWSESRKRRPDWTCWVSISQSWRDIQYLSQHVCLFVLIFFLFFFVTCLFMIKT